MPMATVVRIGDRKFVIFCCQYLLCHRSSIQIDYVPSDLTGRIELGLLSQHEGVEGRPGAQHMARRSVADEIGDDVIAILVCV